MKKKKRVKRCDSEKCGQGGERGERKGREARTGG